MSWIKLPVPLAKYYPNGFTNETEAVGSKYGFTNGVPVLNVSTGMVTLAEGNLSGELSNQIVFVLNQGTGSNQLTLTVAPSTGLLKGSLVDPNSGRKIPFSGAVLQKQNNGWGYFLGTNQGGVLVLEP